MSSGMRLFYFSMKLKLFHRKKLNLFLPKGLSFPLKTNIILSHLKIKLPESLLFKTSKTKKV